MLNNDRVYKQCCKILAEDKSFKDILFRNISLNQEYQVKEVNKLNEIFKEAIDEYANIRICPNIEKLEEINRIQNRYSLLNYIFMLGRVLKKSEMEIQDELLQTLYKRLKELLKIQ